MSDIDFQNGFIVGMTLKGKMGVGSNPVPITFYNGVGVYWSTYVTIVFDQPIDGANIDITKSAFTITGRELGVLVNYAVTGVELLDEFRVGVKCADYKNVDDYLTIIYNRANGQIYGQNGRPVLNFTRQFAPGYMMPKINVSQSVKPMAITAFGFTVAMQQISHGIVFRIDSPNSTITNQQISTFDLNSIFNTSIQEVTHVELSDDIIFDVD